jgi:hypothetical protein
MNNKLPKILIASAALSLLGAGTSLVAAGTPINVGDTLPDFTNSDPTSMTLPSASDPKLTSWVSSADTGIDGYMGSYVLTGNSYGANDLTFVYQFKNTSPADSLQGVSFLVLNGFSDSLSLSIALGNTVYDNSPTSPIFDSNFVLPKWVSRPGGDQLWFAFPPDVIAPPIFGGENSFQLVVYTNATNFTDTQVANVITDRFTSTDPLTGDYDANNPNHLDGGTAGILAPSTVPENGSTAILVGLGLVSFSLARFKRKQ